MTKPRGTGMRKIGGGSGGDGGGTDGMILDPWNGIGKTKLTKKLKSSVCLGRKKKFVGAKSKAGKGIVKKLGWSDSSQPGIRKFLLKIEEIKNSSNGNSPGNFPIPL